MGQKILILKPHCGGHSFRVTKVTRRTLRREMRQLRRFIRSNELFLSYLLHGRYVFNWRGVPQLGMGSRNRLSHTARFREQEQKVAQLKTRLDACKSEANAMLPTRQKSRPRVKYDRRLG